MADEFDPYQAWLNIEPHERPADHYRLLGLKRFEFDVTRIESAANERMALVRSYQTGPRGKHTQELLNRLAAAKLCLLNPATKASYDQSLVQLADHVPAPQSQAVAPSEPAPQPNPGVPFGFQAASNMPLPTMASPPQPPIPLAPPPIHSPPVAVSPSLAPVRAAAVPPEPPPISPPSARESKDDEDADAEFRNASDRRFSPLAWTAVLLAIAVTLAVGFVGWRRYREHQAFVAAEQAAEEEAAARAARAQRAIVPDETELVSDEPIVVVQQEADGGFNFSPALARTSGPTVERLLDGDREIVGNWKSPDDRITWTFRVVRPSIMRVQVVYRLPSDKSGGSYELSLDPETKKRMHTSDFESAGDIATDEFYFRVQSGGEHRLTLSGEPDGEGELMRLHSIRFIPHSN
ncbi:MAG: hypothetical protein KDA71_20635 [Planctomycetales bacterium]|nr:hypothetical protein [Planctomycetales bacterium]